MFCGGGNENDDDDNAWFCMPKQFGDVYCLCLVQRAVIQSGRANCAATPLSSQRCCFLLSKPSTTAPCTKTYTTSSRVSGGFCRGAGGELLSCARVPSELWWRPKSETESKFSIKINYWLSSSTKLNSTVCTITEKNNYLPAVIPRRCQVFTRVW